MQNSNRMDRVSRALGLGFGRTDEDDSLQPNDGTGTGNVETRAQTMATVANDNNNSWALVMAQQRGTDMAVTQTQEQEQAPPRQRVQLLTMEPLEQPRTQKEEFLGIGMALKQKGHLNYEPSTVAAELLLQRDIQGNTTKQTAFREFATNYTQLRVYLAMVGEQKMVTMIHTIGAFYSIRAATNAY
jgi:hypothetical protein